jgi:hypothetical protein
MNKESVLKTLNRIMELELAGVVRYTHYALMVYGYNRIPIVSWLEKNADESLAHARAAGELVTWLGGHPSLSIGPLLESHMHDIGDILRESRTGARPGCAARGVRARDDRRRGRAPGRGQQDAAQAGADGGVRSVEFAAWRRVGVAHRRSCFRSTVALMWMTRGVTADLSVVRAEIDVCHVRVESA